ncbi:hypothetical protein CASFOL_039379 [Castilleja foliolosa]|uniref:Uncharacterized protein n=1 Tax=Castilleja foliolosa TaxID=1961234 RepID=A0ABD3BHU5_9LAMI
MSPTIYITKWISLIILFFSLEPQIYTQAQQQVPCMFLFGDSLFDNGNNKLLIALSKSNYRPYGIDYRDGPTGRYSNGRVISDFLAELLGFVNPISSFVTARGSDTLRGVNYASGGAGILEESGVVSGFCFAGCSGFVAGRKFLFCVLLHYSWSTVILQLATIVSIRRSERKPIKNGEQDKFLNRESKEETIIEQLGLLENLMQIIYQVCAGAVLLTDIVFWCLLLPFMIGENFQLTLIIGIVHSVNAVFLIIETALNRVRWPYPFLDLSTPLAPLWYLALALVHIPCYGLYVLLTKAKHVSLPRMFPNAFVR